MLTLKAPAKINWFLHILGKREDAYHEIRSLMQCVSLYDSLVFEDSSAIEVQTEADIPLEKNLVYRAAIVLKEATGHKGGARITLKKDIPEAAGLGGGSSDAAATLRGLNELWETGLSKEALSTLAASLGSDIPFFMNGPSALVEGRGEKLTPVDIGTPVTLLLLKPDMGVSAGWAYSNARNRTINAVDTGSFITAIEGRDYSALEDMLGNDLEEAVLERHPEIRRMMDAVLENGAVLSAMSGSGSTVFGLFESPGQAEEAQGKIKAHWSAVVETLVAMPDAPGDILG
jgi:4-diphosphocytidyl-2-C-methyl-D-erythritol kinase